MWVIKLITSVLFMTIGAIHTDRRIKLGGPFQFNNRTELMVYLISHELAHSFQLRRKSFTEREYLANDHAESVVLKWREQKKEVWQRIIKPLRRWHRKENKKKVVVLKNKNEIQTERLNKYRIKLKEWQRSIKLANTKIQIYSSKIKRLEKLLQNQSSDILSNNEKDSIPNNIHLQNSKEVVNGSVQNN